MLTIKCIAYVGALNIPNFDTATLIKAGTTRFRDEVPRQYLPDVLVAYNDALRRSFRAGLVIALFESFASPRP
jgi:hypothetical protein